jgi:hypothetical protein
VALKRTWIPSPNYSSRGGSSVRLIVLHTAEGARTYQDLGAFFANPSSGVSSHVGIDDTPGVIGEYVKRAHKAWTQGNANPVATAAELCAFHYWDSAEWQRHSHMLANTAAWVAEEAAYYNIPLVKLTPAQAQGSGRGVCQHVDLGAWGGGHVDCGHSFPIDQVIAMAKGETSTSPVQARPIGGEVFIKYQGTTYQLIHDGDQSYWRSLPSAAAAKLPAGWVIDDSNGDWFRLWKKGAAA